MTGFFLLAYVLLDAFAQGKLTLLARWWIPAADQRLVNLPLHFLQPGLFVLVCGYVGFQAGFAWVAVGLMLRLALFDVVLNLSKADPPFYVGESALVDKALRSVARTRAPVLSAVLRTLALFGAVEAWIFA